MTLVALVLLVLSTLILLTGVGTVVCAVVTDDPRLTRGYVPPRSHPTDDFERTGSSYC